ncbi:hypothetical protein Tco_0389307 [Tanacetum coccineum]
MESGLEVCSIRRIQWVGYGVLEFLGVGTTFDIFQNIHILFLEYGVLILSGYGVLILTPLWSLMSAGADTPSLLSPLSLVWIVVSGSSGAVCNWSASGWCWIGGVDGNGVAGVPVGVAQLDWWNCWRLLIAGMDVKKRIGRCKAGLVVLLRTDVSLNVSHDEK